MRVGFVGLGDQGAPMARAIAEQGWSLSVWARRLDALSALSGTPHRVCQDVTELGRECDLVGLCVGDDSDVEEILFSRDLLASMKPGSIVANHSTGSPDVCPEYEQRGLTHGVHMLDAPVSGGRVGAENKNLTVMVGGNEAAYLRSRPVFAAFSTTCCFMGPSGSGQLAKLVNNILFAANLSNAEELLVVGERLGFDVRVLVDLTLVSSGMSFATETLARHMSMDLAEHYRSMIAKDVEHFVAAARARGIDASPLEERARRGVDGLCSAMRNVRRTVPMNEQGQDVGGSVSQ